MDPYIIGLTILNLIVGAVSIGVSISTWSENGRLIHEVDRLKQLLPNHKLTIVQPIEDIDWKEE